MVFAEAPATPDSVSRKDSLSRQPIDGLDVNFEDLRYLRWSYNLIHWYAPFYDVLWSELPKSSQQRQKSTYRAKRGALVGKKN